MNKAIVNIKLYLAYNDLSKRNMKIETYPFACNLMYTQTEIFLYGICFFKMFWSIHNNTYMIIAAENIFDIEIAQADKWYISTTQLSLSSPYMMIQYETRRLS